MLCTHTHTDTHTWLLFAIFLDQVDRNLTVLRHPLCRAKRHRGTHRARRCHASVSALAKWDGEERNKSVRGGDEEARRSCVGEELHKNIQDDASNQFI